jgi:glucosylceramidase
MMRASTQAIAALVLLAPALAQQTISVWQTAKDTADRLSPQPALQFTRSRPDRFANATNTTEVTINATATFQQIEWGFGGAITESAVYVFSKLDAAAQAEVLADLYGENENGTSLRYTFGRITIGSCDFSLGYYSYNDEVNDTAMTNFTIAHDEEAIVPFILRAQAAAAANNRTLGFISTPWSPPGWMKSNGLMSCFPLGPLDCALLPEFQPAWALYLSKYLTAYKAAGVNVQAITVQNEPQPQTGTLTYEGVWFPFPAELEFVAEYLGPQLAGDHPDIKIFVFDHNQADMVWYASPILADPIASKYVAGTAFHWYSGPQFDTLADMHELFPDKLLLPTEATVGRGYGTNWFSDPLWDNGEYYATFILNDLNNWAVGFLDWNILLDQNGAPDHGDPTGELCEGLIQCGSDAMLIADLSQNPPVVYKQTFYYYVGHVSRFIQAGSTRIGSIFARITSNGTEPSPVLGTSFVDTDGNTVLVMMNQQNTTETVVVNDPRYGSVSSILLPRSIQTWVY